MNTLPEAERHDLNAVDSAPLRLTRYRGGTKGPVLLVHGAGVWSGMFKLPTLSENFVQYLVRHGYDTWLLDWRASIELPLRQFSLDDAAQYDMPAAVRYIREATRADSLQAVVHCAGSVTFFMSMAAGYLPEVRSVVASQIALHHQVPPATHFKALLRLPDMLDVTMDSLTPLDDSNHPLFESALGTLVDLVHRECSSTVCHRLTFLYGHLYQHARLNTQTHERLDEQFGRCNMQTFRHLAQMARAGCAVRYDYGPEENLRRYGRAEPPDYLDATHLRRPITFVVGDHNQTYQPISTQLTYDWLRRAHGDSLYQRKVLQGYGHLDTFMGSTAASDTYPVILEALEAMG